jgi:small-conductance mechanosensitive channel
MEKVAQIMGSEHLLQDLVIIGLELVIILLLFYILRKAGGIIINALIKTRTFARFEQPINTSRKLASLSFTLFFVVALMSVLSTNLYQIYLGTDLKTYTLALFSRIPDGFFTEASIAIGRLIILLIAARYFIRFLHKQLDKLEIKAVEYKGLRENDDSVSYFFKSLKTIKTVAIWILVFYFALKLSPLADKAGNVLLVLKVYLIIHIGLLIVSAVAAIVDSLNALSKRYAESNNLLIFYNKLSTLIPLLRRSIEYIIYVGVTTLVLHQTDFVPGLAKYGPGIIQAIGLMFLARVALEVVNLFLDITMLPDRLTEDERNKNLTILPIIKSILSAIVYFITLVLILKGIGFDPIPLLAGAGILSMVVGLGAQSLINDILSGFFVIFEGQYKVGDFIETSKARGTVESISLRITTIRNPDGQLHILRNGEIKEVINFSQQYTHASIKVGVDPQYDLDKVYATIIEIGKTYAEEDTNVLEPTIVQGVEDIDSSEIIIKTQTKVKPGTHLSVSRGLKRQLTDGLKKAGIEIPFKDRNIAVVVNA